MTEILNAMVRCPQLMKNKSDNTTVADVYYDECAFDQENGSWLLKHLQPRQFADYCQQLHRKNILLDAQSALNLLEVFCKMYWRLEEWQKPCYDLVTDLWRKTDEVAKMQLIPVLMHLSIVCNNFVFLAQELLDSLSKEQQKALKLYMPGWTNQDEYSDITIAEYRYRLKHGLPCNKEEIKFPIDENRVYHSEHYTRPSCINDLMCFRSMLDILYQAEQKCLFMTGLQ